MSSQNELEQINYKQIRLMKSVYNDAYDIAEDFIGIRGGKKDADSLTKNEGYADDLKEEDDNLKEGLKNIIKGGNEKKGGNQKKYLKVEEEFVNKINLGIDKKTSDSDNSTLIDGLRIIIVILLTTTMFKNIIHKATGAFESTSFDKMFIVPIFNIIVEQIKMIMRVISTAQGISNIGQNMFKGGDPTDTFDILNWSVNTKMTVALFLFIPLLWLSQFFLSKISEIINWMSNVKWKEIFNMLVSGKGFNDKLFPDMGLYNKPKNPLLITIFSVYFVYLAGKVFINYFDFWAKIPLFFVIFLCIWFGALMFPFLNISTFIFFITMAAYTLIMPLIFYYDGSKPSGGQFFPHSFMDTLNRMTDLGDWMKKFIDASYKIFIFISAVLFFYKVGTLKSTNLKTFYAAISGLVFLIWAESVRKEYFPDTVKETQLPDETIPNIM